MLFNSFEFLYLFLPLTWLGYFVLQHRRRPAGARLWLLSASLIFYSWWNIRYLPLYIGSISGNYLLSRAIRKTGPAPNPAGRRLLVLGITANVSLLVYFKYSDFFISNLRWLTGSNIAFLHLALPLAISFFTIQQLVYLVDTYEGVTYESPFLDYTLFISFFPHLIAGPIVQHRELIPQFHQVRRHPVNYRNVWRGMLVMAAGLLKKVLLADTFAIWVRQGFDQGATLSFASAWAASLSYTLQLYFDFSGYSDMAIGIALLFNLEMPINFRSPYRARNMIQFWQNWHITLSRFITHYLYTPIFRAMPKATFWYSMLATMIAMLIAGAWHGADWKFILFGFLHGTGIVSAHLWKRRKLKKLPGWLAWFATFFWVNLAFVFFRARTWADAGRVLRGMFAPTSFEISTIQPWLLMVPAFFILLRLPTLEEWFSGKRDWGFRTVLVTVGTLLVTLTALEFQNANEFLYFKF